MGKEQTLKPEELAIAISKLEVPVIISDIVRGKELLTRDVQYALHESISDLQPDSALLCIALSARKITGAQEKTFPSLQVLQMECDRIIEDYAPLWLRNARGEPVEEDDALEILSSTVEDLEDLAELIGSCEMPLKSANGDAASLFTIMRVQAQAHAMVAEAYFQMMEETPKHDMPPHIAGKALEAAATTNNVILFPLQKRA